VLVISSSGCYILIKTIKIMTVRTLLIPHKLFCQKSNKESMDWERSFGCSSNRFLALFWKDMIVKNLDPRQDPFQELCLSFYKYPLSSDDKRIFA